MKVRTVPFTPAPPTNLLVDDEDREAFAKGGLEGWRALQRKKPCFDCTSPCLEVFDLPLLSRPPTRSQRPTATPWPPEHGGTKIYKKSSQKRSRCRDLWDPVSPRSKRLRISCRDLYRV